MRTKLSSDGILLDLPLLCLTSLGEAINLKLFTFFRLMTPLGLLLALLSML